MPTQNEILKKHTDKYRTLRVINQSVIEQIEKSLGEAAEEYAKQEAKELLKFLHPNTRMNFNYIWNEYQKSKTDPALFSKDAEQGEAYNEFY